MIVAVDAPPQVGTHDATAYTPSKRGTNVTSPTRKSTARKATARKATSRKATARKATARKAPARKATARKATARKPAKATAKATAKVTAKAPRARKATPVKRAAPAAARVAAAPRSEAPAPGTVDLAGGLRSYLGSIDVEVRAVSSLSERIDALVVELNDLRDQQAKRLVVLDKLRASVTDTSLGTFLEKAIKPRKTRVPEVIPARLG